MKAPVGSCTGVNGQGTSVALMCALRPDVLVKGWRRVDSTCVAEAAPMAEWGGVTRQFPRLETVSTAVLMDRIALMPGRASRRAAEGFVQLPGTSVPAQPAQPARPARPGHPH